MEIKTGHLKCSSCGAPLNLPEGTLIKNRIKCSFCGVENYIYNEDISTGGTNFELTDAGIHRHLIDVISSATLPPHDIFEEINITKISKLVIPAYWYENCTAIGTMLFQQGFEKKIKEYNASTDSFEDSTETEWKPMSRAFSTTRDFLLSGNEKYAEIIKQMYSEVKKNDIKKAEELNFPKDCEETTCDLTEGTVFAGTLRELAEKVIDEKGRNAVQENDKQIFSKIEDITIQKGEVKKVALAIYEIVYDYKGTEYKIYLSNNGENYAYSEFPSDPEITARIDQIKRELDELDESPKKKNLIRAFFILFIAGLILLAVFFIGIFLLIGAVVVAILYIPIAKEFISKNKALKELKEEFNLGFIKARNKFNTDKVAMKGVLSHVSGDPEAFGEIVEIKEEAVANNSN
ncbi:MAG: hypothetical protein IKS60_04200 [Lachnospiraceae bacterium]|nr:hypothetical protein [Lachnospiraceae bacterium]MBR4412792.1 hypothetical protein [Lachnospiraceae bacterium]MBR5067654.1 hypothetical protein [Lachnospiraceae bacterium]MBR5917400.1 hypothetical protein [Lachnospiraceae bacterium]